MQTGPRTHKHVQCHSLTASICLFFHQSKLLATESCGFLLGQILLPLVHVAAVISTNRHTKAGAHLSPLAALFFSLYLIMYQKMINLNTFHLQSLRLTKTFDFCLVYLLFQCNQKKIHWVLFISPVLRDVPFLRNYIDMTWLYQYQHLHVWQITDTETLQGFQWTQKKHKIPILLSARRLQLPSNIRVFIASSLNVKPTMMQPINKCGSNPDQRQLYPD